MQLGLQSRAKQGLGRGCGLTKHSVLVVGLLQLLEALAQHVPQLIQAQLLAQQWQLWRSLLLLLVPSMRAF